MAVTVAQLDDAIRLNNYRLGRANRHSIFCCIEGCGRTCLANEARELWVDGVKRGYACATCTWGLL